MARRDRLDAAALDCDVWGAAGVLRTLGNERRLMVLRKLVEGVEMNVTSLAEAVGLSQSALSQHLARMRTEGLIAFRRESRTSWYRIADPRVAQLLALLRDLFCQHPPKRRKEGRT